MKKMKMKQKVEILEKELELTRNDLNKALERLEVQSKINSVGLKHIARYKQAMQIITAVANNCD